MDIQNITEILGNFDMQISEKSDGAYQSTIGEKACKYAIAALNELEQYRQLGTVDEIKKSLDELRLWHKSHTNELIKNPFANQSTLICHNCDHKDEYIEELEITVEEYEQIGTADECRAAREKMKPKKIHKRVDGTLHEEERAYIYCPSCKSYIKELNYFTNCLTNEKFCPTCGQALDRTENESEKK